MQSAETCCVGLFTLGRIAAQRRLGSDTVAEKL